MSQQPFASRGAVDLSGLKRPASGQPGAAGQPGQPAAGAGGPASAYAVRIDEQNFQSVVEESMTAPVLLVFYSPSQSPQSTTMADDVVTAVGEYDGRFLAGLADIDAVPSIAQALQIQQVPTMLVIVEGRPATQPIPGLLGLEDIQTLLQQLGQQLTAQGITGRHQPRGEQTEEAEQADAEAAEPAQDPRYAAAQDALARNDVEAAVAEYQKLVDANPADTEAAGGLAMARVLQRTQGADLNQAREAAAANPDDVDAQTLAADLDLLGGHVEDAFARLVALVGRSGGAERDRAREHLLDLFAAVGNDDPRVLQGRQSLASALF